MKKRISPAIKEVISHSKKGALLLGHRYLDTQHLLLSILRKSDSFAVKVFTSLGVDIRDIIKAIDENISHNEMTTTPSEINELPLNQYAYKALKIMPLEAGVLKNEEVCLEHLVLAILRSTESTAAKILHDLNVDYDRYKGELVYIYNEIQKDSEDDDEGMRGGTFEEGNTQRRDPETPISNHFGRDITKSVKDRLYPTIERDAEIRLIAQMLCKKEKNNVLIIGEPGVGKRAIIEEFAYQIQHNSMYSIHYNRIIELDWGKLMTNAKYRGTLEKRIQEILNEIANFPKTIILLNHMHVASQFTGKGLLISDILKPSLEYGEFKFIGITTPDKYHLIAEDHTMDSYFRKIFIQPLSLKQTIRVLENIKPKYEEFHNVTYEKSAIEACVKLTHLQGSILPGKAVDLLDEIAIQVRMDEVSTPQELIELRQKIQNIQDKKIQAVKMQKYEAAADFRDEEVGLTHELELKELLWEETFNSIPLTIKKQDVEKAFQSIKKFRQP